MSNPLRAPLVRAEAGSDSFPDASFTPGPLFKSRQREGCRLELLQQALAPLDMIPENAIVMPAGMSLDERYQNGDRLVVASKGKQTFRVRSAFARRVAEAVWAATPNSGGFWSRAACRERITGVLFCDGGAEHTVGRLVKHYPRIGDSVQCPPTEEEASAAVERAGVSLLGYPTSELRPYPLIAREGDPRAVTVNPKASTGLPVMRKWEDPGVPERVMGLATALRREIRNASRAPGGVEGWKREAEAGRPHLVALVGKAKGDYYKVEKVEAGEMRFYNVLPKPIVLNMQVATQPLEALARHVGHGSTSTQGFSLVRGGAQQLVEALDARWRQSSARMAYVHCGDDSWVVLKAGPEVVMFALDCTSFDLTQHADATLEIHKALHRQLSRVDKPAADLWFAYARERLVVTTTTLVYRWRHAGPSGMPLQSKVNDLLMEVLLDRLARTMAKYWKPPEGFPTDADIAREVEQEGAKLGLKVRVETLTRTRAASVEEALEQNPFLFIGYYFYREGGRVKVCADLPRTLAQLPYPGLKWERDKSKFGETEVMRLGSMLQSLGEPPAAWRPAFEAWKGEIIRMAATLPAEVLAQEDKRLRWAVGEGPHGPPAEPSLRGLLRAIERGAEALWAAPMPSFALDEFLRSASDENWADAVEEEEREREARREVYIPPPGREVAAMHLNAGPSNPLAHPTTAGNHGRPPPTARWAPDRMPRPRREAGDVPPRWRQRWGKVLEEEEEEWGDEFEEGWEWEASASAREWPHTSDLDGPYDFEDDLEFYDRFKRA